MLPQQVLSPTNQLSSTSYRPVILQSPTGGAIRIIQSPTGPNQNRTFIGPNGQQMIMINSAVNQQIPPQGLTIQNRVKVFLFDKFRAYKRTFFQLFCSVI